MSPLGHAEGVRFAFRGPHGGNWHPLTTLSHLLDVELFGLDPRGHHGVNVLLRIVTQGGASTLDLLAWVLFTLPIALAVWIVKRVFKPHDDLATPPAE